MLDGVRKLGWPAVELRLWQEWDEGDLAQVARRVRDAGIVVNSVHVPPDSEVLLPMRGQPGNSGALADLMERSLAAALAAGARVAVVHAWDLRLPTFSSETLVENLARFAATFGGEGVSLSVENIPGHVRMFPLIAEACPEVSFTADTRWSAHECSWDLLLGLVQRITNIHVQTYIDPIEGGGVTLGRLDTCGPFNAQREVRRFVESGYAGLVTLEPNGVPSITETHLRQALEMLQGWVSSPAAEPHEAAP